MLGVHSNTPLPVASVPQEKTPFVLLTSQLAALRADTVKFVVDAVLVTVKAVVEAKGIVILLPNGAVKSEVPS